MSLVTAYLLSSGSGGVTSAQVSQLVADVAGINATLHAVNEGGPILTVPALDVPSGLVAVFWRPTAFGAPATASAAVHYLNTAAPVTNSGAELVRHAIKFTKAAPSDAYAHVFLPVSDEVMWTECADASLNSDTGRFKVLVLPENRTSWFEDELREQFTP